MFQRQDSEMLQITDYGTIVGYGKKEIKISKFLDNIDKKIDKYTISPLQGVGYKSGIKYCGGVIKNKEAQYIVQIDDVNYIIDTKDNIDLAEELDAYVVTTEAHLFEEHCASEIESGNKVTTNQYRTYLGTLEKAYQRHYEDIINNLLKFLSLPVLSALGFIGGISGVLTNSMPLIVAASVTLVADISVIMGSSFDLKKSYDNFQDSLRLRRANLRQTSRIEKILRKGQAVDAKSPQMVKEDFYRDAMINYMNSIMRGTDKLKGKEKKARLTELHEILGEYIEKCKKLSTSTSKKTPIEDRRSKIISDTLSKLVKLEMEMTKSTKSGNNTDKEIVESSILMRQLEDRMTFIDAMQPKVSIAKGKK